ncbi:MAG: ABC transporter permease [Spirochaetaceae bacterium]
MDYIINGISKAFKLILSLDLELYKIIALSIIISVSATLLSAITTIPTAIYLGLKDFKLKKIYTRLLYTFMSIPSVLVGLLVALLLSRRGPLGWLELMYTPTAMVIAQYVLVSPLMTGLIFTIVKKRGKVIENTGRLLGARKLHLIILVAKELKVEIMMAILTSFSRAISEVGAVMIVGGNIKGHTRVITTSIVMFNSMGDYEIAIALGLILLIISLVINIILRSQYEY